MLVFFFFFPGGENLMSAMDTVGVLFFFPIPCLENSLGYKTLELQELAQGRKHYSLYSSEFYIVLTVISATLYLGG